MKILVTPTSFLNPENHSIRSALEAFADEVIYNDLGRPLRPEEILERLPGVNGYIASVDRIGADLIAAAPETLRVISRYGVSVDNIDLVAAKRRGIAVTNTPGANSASAAEQVFAFMLAFSRRLFTLDSSVRSGGWPRIEGSELKGKTLSILGFGSIGKALAVRAAAFGMRILAVDDFFHSDFAKEYDVSQVSIEQAIREADYLSIHLPYCSETHHLINASSLGMMKPTAVLINTAHGDIIDEDALADALESDRIAGACLDVFSEEPFVPQRLRACKNTILTPHASGHTSESLRAMAELSVRNCIKVLTGRPCRFIINR